ncbi:MAG: patatin-like phospholipase family protein [Chlamydiota bacterium]
MFKKLFLTLFIGLSCLLQADGKDSKREDFHILTFDGGGIRGAFTAQILAMLDEELDFLKDVDLFAGTSTGSIIAYGLAYGLTPKKLVEL